MFNFTAIAIVTAACYFIYCIWNRTATRRERFRLLNTLADLSPEQMEAFNKTQPNGWWKLEVKKNTVEILRPACLLIGLGLGLLIAWLLVNATFLDSLMNDSLQINDDRFGVLTGFITLACPLFFAGVGLMAAFFIEKKFKKD